MAKIKVTQIRSVIDRPLRQKLTIDALGLGRPHWFKIHNDTPQIRGMVNKVTHLVTVEDYTGDDSQQPEKKTEKKKVRKTVKKPSAGTRKTSVKKGASKKKAKESK